jgi:hypothetical protein
MSLSRNAYPHIFDAIFARAPHGSLLALRTVSRDLRDRVDATLVKHVAIRVPYAHPPPWGTYSLHHYLWSVRDGKHYRIPRWDWYRRSGGAVRVVDIHTPSDAVAVSLANAAAAQHGHTLPHDPDAQYPPGHTERGRMVCWCGPDQLVGLVLEILEPLLPNIDVVGGAPRGLHPPFRDT